MHIHHKTDKLQDKFEDTKGVIRIHKSKKGRQHNDQKKKDKGTNNDLQNCLTVLKELVMVTVFLTEKIVCL
jgi:hypothetical protein